MTAQNISYITNLPPTTHCSIYINPSGNKPVVAHSNQIPEFSTRIFLKNIAATGLTSAITITSVIASSYAAALSLCLITESTGEIALKLAATAALTAVTIPTCIAISFLISKIAIQIIEKSRTDHRAHLRAIIASAAGGAIAIPITGSPLMSIPIGTFIGGLAGGIYAVNNLRSLA